MPSSWRRFTLMPVIVLLALATHRAAADDPSWSRQSERWYIYEIGGARAGWMHETVDARDNLLRTTTTMELRIGRANVESSVTMVGTFIETRDGKPVSMTSTQSMSAQSTTTHYEFIDDGIQLTTTAGGRETTRTQPAPEGQWLPPQALQRFLAERHEARPKQFSYRTMDPNNGIETVDATTSFVREDTFTFDGRDLPVTVWSSRTNVLPVETTEMYSADDVLVFWEAVTGMGKMTMYLATRDDAQADHGNAAPELLVSAFARSDRPINDHLRCTQLRYRLTAKKGSLPDLPTAGGQRIASTTNTQTVLIVDIDNNVPATDAEQNDAQFRQSSALIDSDDPLIRKLAERALRSVADDADAMTRAERLRAFTYDHVGDKGFETAFASASETARTRTGDCSEHAVLLAALLRAVGLPSRVASGLVYVTESDGKGLFGWHMWTQALIDGRWVDFDATLPVRYTAGHILTSTSAFSDGSSSTELNALLVLMGNLDIEVLEFAPASATQQPPAR